MWQIFCLRSDRKPETSFDRQINVFFCEIWIAGPNGDVRTVTVCSEVAVFANVQYKFDKNSPQRLTRRRAAFELQCFAIAALSSIFH